MTFNGIDIHTGAYRPLCIKTRRAEHKRDGRRLLEPVPKPLKLAISWMMCTDQTDQIKSLFLNHHYSQISAMLDKLAYSPGLSAIQKLTENAS